MEPNSEAFEGAEAMCAAGVLSDVRRVGLPPLDADSDLEFEFLNPAGNMTFCVSVGPVSASDLVIRPGEALQVDYGHLQHEAPAAYANTVKNWLRREESLAAWAIGASLSDPQRLQITEPYTEVVGFSFLCSRAGEVLGRLALIGESDNLHAANLDDPVLAAYWLEPL